MYIDPFHNVSTYLHTSHTRVYFPWPLNFAAMAHRADSWLGKTTAYNVDNLPFALTFAIANAPAFYVHHFVVIPYAFITRPSRSDPFQIM